MKTHGHKMVLPKEMQEPSNRAEDYMLLIFGPPKVGKTTFASQFDRPLFFSTDRGTRFIKTYSMDVLSWKDFLIAIKLLETKGADRYGCFVIDHVDDLFKMCQDYTCKKMGIEHPADGEWGKGWAALRDTFIKGMRRLLRQGQGIIFIAHEDIKTIKTRTSEIERTMPAMPKTARRIIIPAVDVIAYAGFKIIKKGKERIQQRVLITEPTESLEVGDRTGRCPPSMPLNGRRFLHMFTKGVVTHEEGKETSRRGRRRRGGAG